MHSKIFLFLLFQLVRYFYPTSGNSTQAQRIEVFQGETIFLKCDVNLNKLNENLFWKSGNIRLAVGNNLTTKSNRFRLEPGKLLILNATLKDNRLFWCHDTKKRYSTFHVVVNELFCRDVDQFENAEVYYHPPANENGDYKYGSRVSYQCHEGFELIGEETRYCIDPGTKWSGVEPRCKDSFLNTLEFRLLTLENTCEKLLIDTEQAQSRNKATKDDIQNHYSLWEYLLNDLSTYKRHIDDVVNKLNMEIRRLSGVLVRKPLIPPRPRPRPRPPIIRPRILGK